MSAARFEKDVALYERARLYGYVPTKPQQARIDSLKACGAWKWLESRYHSKCEVEYAEYVYRELTGTTTKADRAEIQRLLEICEEQTGPNGEVYGHRG